MIDLHTHTVYSDGSWSVKELLTEAQKSKIEILSITDHDNVNAYLELQNNDYHNIFNGDIINGVELNVIAYGAKIEILGYDFELDEVNRWCIENYNKKISLSDRVKQYKDMVLAAKKNGIIIDDLKYDPVRDWPVSFIYKQIIMHEENKKKFRDEEFDDYKCFLRSFSCDSKFPLYTDLSNIYPSINDAVEMIRLSKGKVFLAHLYKYPISDIDGFLDDLVSDNLLDGLEVYHSSFSPEQMEYLKRYCDKNNLYISGGSDCHGKKYPSRKIGVGYDNLNIPKEEILRWLNPESKSLVYKK